jgi:hypothetical protein
MFQRSLSAPSTRPKTNDSRVRFYSLHLDRILRHHKIDPQTAPTFWAKVSMVIKARVESPQADSRVVTHSKSDPHLNPRQEPSLSLGDMHLLIRIARALSGRERRSFLYVLRGGAHDGTARSVVELARAYIYHTRLCGEETEWGDLLDNLKMEQIVRICQHNS